MTHNAGIAMLAALGFSASTHAASFDCGHAATRTEKMICANAELSTLDDKLAVTYATARAGSPDRNTLKTAQAQWLKRRDACADIDCTRAAYLQRLADLARVAPTYPTLAAAVDATCVELAKSAGLEPSQCKAVESATFGPIGGEKFDYALYCLSDSPSGGSHCSENAIALFSTDRGSHRVARWHLHGDDGGDVFSAPTIVHSGPDTILDIPVLIDGTGDFNDSDLFLRRGNDWVAIDRTSWEKELEKRLPKGLAIWKGIWPDLETMTATAPLYRAKDANCCASGGMATIQLELDGSRLKLKSVQISQEDRD